MDRSQVHSRTVSIVALGVAIMFASLVGAASASSLSGDQAKSKQAAATFCRLTNRYQDVSCFRWRIDKCHRESPSHINCRVVEYRRPGELDPKAIQVCRYWVYIRRSGGKSSVRGGQWHFECNDRTPRRAARVSRR